MTGNIAAVSTSAVAAAAKCLGHGLGERPGVGGEALVIAGEAHRSGAEASVLIADHVIPTSVAL